MIQNFQIKKKILRKFLFYSSYGMFTVLILNNVNISSVLCKNE